MSTQFAAATVTPEMAVRRGWSRGSAVSAAWFFGLFCIFDGGARIVGFEPYVQGLARYGYAPGAGPWIGATLILCTVLYLVPRTATLGAVALSAYLGGAVAAHLSVGEAFWFPALVGIVFWWSLWMRDARVRAVLPLKQDYRNDGSAR